MAEFQIFKGISLIFRDSADHKSNSSSGNISGFSSGFIEIAYCRDGRMEYNPKNNILVLKKGDIGIIQSDEEMDISYSARHYQGVSVIIDIAVAADNLSSYMDGINISISNITNKVCRCKKYYVFHSSHQLEKVFNELCQEVPDDYKIGYYKIKVLELLMLLSDVDSACSKHQEQCSKEQADLVKQICEYIRENIHIRLTIEDIAKQFHMSSSQLKKCFICVCGKPVYSFIRTYKMQLAAKELKDTEQSIIEIAATYGYENSSKFANAFKAVMGVTPSQYRKEIRTQNIFLEQ